MTDPASWLRPFARARGTPAAATTSPNNPPSSSPQDSDANSNTVPPTPTSASLLTAASATDSSSSSSSSSFSAARDIGCRATSVFGHGWGSGSGGMASPTIPAPAPISMLPLTQVADEDDGDEPQHARERREGELVRMVEALMAVMAGKRDALDGIPARYNAHVLALIEGFARATRQLRGRDEQLAELRDLREKELEQFRGISEEWMKREEAYKAEIKRLELVLARESRDGVASVALARQESLVDRTGMKRFRARVNRISNSHEQDITADGEPTLPSGTQPAGLAQATTAYKTLGSIPRILDPNSDELISRLVVMREREQQRALHQQRRIRTPPANIHQSAIERVDHIHRNPMKDQKELSPFAEDLDILINKLPKSGKRRYKGRDCETSHPELRRQSSCQPPDALSSDCGSSGSSDSGNSTKAPSKLVDLTPAGQVKMLHTRLPDPKSHPSGTQAAQDGRLSGQEADRGGESSSQTPDLCSGDEGIFSTVMSTTPNSPARRNEPYRDAIADQGPARKQRSRVYSFQKGDDEILTLAQTPWDLQVYSLSTESERASQRADGPGAGVNLAAVSHVDTNKDAAPVPRQHASGVASVTASDGVVEATQHLGLGYGSLTPSTSTGSVIWVGAADTGAVKVTTLQTSTRTNTADGANVDARW
ncbi:hypothetical protein MFIFM68171_04308 [Madurella fahalii]|uniref:Uncharacterized protein n=1 Tax=Madurella fahalii TaxID=1157608 RepID=A0ABQ0G8J8_9PEZI